MTLKRGFRLDVAETAKRQDGYHLSRLPVKKRKLPFTVGFPGYNRRRLKGSRNCHAERRNAMFYDTKSYGAKYQIL
jgi:hypothetical protein